MKDTIIESVVDNYKEHSQHTEIDMKCSECYKEESIYDIMKEEQIDHAKEMFEEIFKGTEEEIKKGRIEIDNEFETDSQIDNERRGEEDYQSFIDGGPAYW